MKVDMPLKQIIKPKSVKLRQTYKNFDIKKRIMETSISRKNNISWFLYLMTFQFSLVI